MSVETFYVVMAGICFTLLGLWWLVLTAQHMLWMHYPDRRRLAYHLSLYFALPGAMSLVSLLTPESPYFWRGAFLVMGVFGAIEAIMMVRRGQNAVLESRPARMTLPIIAGLYVIIAVIAIRPQILSSLGIDVEPVAIEALFLVLLLLFGINLAWLGFMRVSMEGHPESPGEAAGREA
jgi:hypothetical protein